MEPKKKNAPSQDKLQEGVYVWHPVRPKIKEPWYMTFQLAQEQLAKDREIWGLPRAVLDFLESRLDFENYIYLPQADICEALAVDKSNVSKAISLLCKKGIVEKQKVGRITGYRLNHFYAWKGRIKNMPPVASHLKVVK